MIRFRSCRDASWTSRFTADCPPTSASAPSILSTAARMSLIVCVRGLRVVARRQRRVDQCLPSCGVHLQRRRRAAAGLRTGRRLPTGSASAARRPSGSRPGRRPGWRSHAVDLLDRGDDGVGLVGLGEDDGRRAGALVEVVVVDVLAGDRVRLRGEAVDRRQALGLQAGDRDDARDQQDGGADPGRDGACCRPTRRSGPTRRAWRCRSGGRAAAAWARRSTVRETTSSAGSTVSITMPVQAMPTAHTGPRLAVDLRSATVRQSRPRMTVTADAPIGWAAAFQATVIACSRLGYSCNSSRYLLISSSA